MSYISQLMQKKAKERAQAGVQPAPARKSRAAATAAAYGIPVVTQKVDFSNVDPHVVALSDPKSPAAEEYRILRTNIHKLRSAKPIRTIMITSAVEGEGKTLTSVNLSVMMAQDMGQRVVLADCDLRKGRVHELLGFESQKGLGDVLVNGTDPSLAFYKTSVPNFTVVPRGECPENPSELLGSQKMETLLGGIKRGYDACILDTPPILAITDAAVLASQVDGVILIGQAGKTPASLIEEAKKALESAHANILGFLLVGVDDPDPRKSYRYYRYAYSAQKEQASK